MFQKVGDAEFVRGEHEVLRFWTEENIFGRLREQNAGKPPWSFLDGPITANNPMGVHHAWGRTYKDMFQRYWAMNGRELRYQNGFDCQGLWVEVEVEKQLGLGAKSAIEDYGIDRFVWECKKRVLKYAAIQTEQSQRLGYWMDWDDPDTLRRLAEGIGTDNKVSILTPRGERVEAPAEQIVERLGNPDWGGSYFTFSTENNETIWTFLKKCFQRGKIYRGHDVMPWSGKAGSAYSQMEVADGRRLTTHRALFVRFPIIPSGGREPPESASNQGAHAPRSEKHPNEYLLIWTTTPWTLTSNVAAMVNPDLEYVQLKTKRDGATYYFAKENLEFQRLAKEFKEGFGRPEWGWPKDCPKLKTIAQIFKEQGGYEIVGTMKGADMIGWRYDGPFDDLPAQNTVGGFPSDKGWKLTRGANADAFVELCYALEAEFDKAEELIRNTFDEQEKKLTEDAAAITKKYAEGLPYWMADGFAEGMIATDTTRETILRAILASFVNKVRQSISEMLVNSQHYGTFSQTVPHFKSFHECKRFFGNLGITCDQTDDWLTLHDCEQLCEIEKTAGIDNLPELTPEQYELFARLEKKGVLVASSGQVAIGFVSILKQCHIGLLKSLDAALEQLPYRTGVECHRVIDGGRDFKGSPNVVAGEGTGIVHSAPGCGDVDSLIGKQWAVVPIAPLAEDGRFLDGFGQFTGLIATAPETVDLIVADLKQKHLLVADEKYPHIYPFCWRTGDELVFRLVDEWFINMDWRDEIMDVTRQIQWLPESIQGQEREVEWLTNMRDWMISKKRYWGLALPIWENPNDPAEFYVVGSLKELKELAVEGWNDFDGHTPHKPWIDDVKIRHPETGHTLRRITDVGNPWLDAGIVPFSTLGFNTHPDLWRKWYPADFVTECFPGQFRNWFYSMLSMSTMMRYDATNDPAQKRPFKTLVGHRLVMNEQGQQMHKADGTAIWFEEAAEQLGVDTLRWMYLQQNPAQDLRFGTRHPDKPVTLQTANGPTDKTIDGVPTRLVTSTPADDVRRQVLLPLWNSYAFFVNYARLDEFDPTLPAVPVKERPEIDRWILSNLQALIGSLRQTLENFDTPGACAAAAAFIDDLSNWYIRRNRRRFWRSREATPTEKPRDSHPWVSAERDKLAAYQTLYEVLLTLTKLLAPLIPFVTERMYHNLTRGEETQGWQSLGFLESVHLCAYPVADAALLDADLNQRMSLAQLVVKLGHKMRDEADQRVRQPLPELRFACADPAQRAAITQLTDVIADELNVKTITPCDSLGDIVKYVYKANLKTLGPKYGKLLNLIKTEIPTLAASRLAPLQSGQAITITLDGHEIRLEPEDVQVSTEQAAEWHCADERGVQVALSSHLTPELIREGLGRDFVRQVQQLRKDADLEIEQRICIRYATDDANVTAAVTEWAEYIRNETLADALTKEPSLPDTSKAVTIGEAQVRIQIA